MDNKDKYELMKDGKVKITFMSESADLKKLDNETVIGDFYNMSVCYVKDKETCIEDLQEKYNKYDEDLVSIVTQLKAININDTLAEELKEYTKKTIEVLESIKNIKDFSNKDYVANNPKKFGKMLKEARILKENMLKELVEVDKVVGLHNKRIELTDQKKLYDKEVTKIANQLKLVLEL